VKECFVWISRLQVEADLVAKRSWIRVAGVVLFLGLVGAAVFTLAQRADSGGTVTGTVLDETGPVAGATVRIQATTRETTTDSEGCFALGGLAEGIAVTVTAWKGLYYCAKVKGVIPPATEVTLTLRYYQTTDNPDYEWIAPVGANSCTICKPGVTQIWLDNDAHAGSALNSRFLTMYNGTDTQGNRSPATQYGSSRDYGSFPLRPDPNQPYFGPGYKLDFPGTAGNCAACHVPGAAVDAPYDTDPNAATGADLFGVHCDFCHKVADVSLDSATGTPYPNRPGVLSMDIRRPFPADPNRYQLFFGTFDDDNVPMEDTNLPLLKESQFCAPCHFGVFWDTVVYNSFGEWLESPYSDPAFEGAKTCQQCHMVAPSVLGGKTITNVAPGKGGVERDPMTIHAHTSPGAMSIELLQNALTMGTAARWEGGRVVVDVSITNDKTGHHVPTDSPLRQLILLVSATDGTGASLPQIAGATVPEWGGVGDPERGYYSGLPGKGFAKILEELWTEVSPTAAYWNMTRILSDNRIAAFETDTSTYSFASPADGEVAVEVRLVFRRAFKTLMEQKGWNTPDILMAHDTFTLGAAQNE
jgi:mono/diheme cytochrome c family protein